MDAKHTQDGPWVEAGLTGRDPIISGGPLRLIKCEGVVIAFLPAWMNVKSEAAEACANARLIAAAPALLEALAPFVLANSSEEWVTLTVRSADIAAARAAIAKATTGAPDGN